VNWPILEKVWINRLVKCLCAYCYTFLCTRYLPHSCLLLKLFNGFRCHLACTLVGSDDTLC